MGFGDCEGRKDDEVGWVGVRESYIVVDGGEFCVRAPRAGLALISERSTV